MLNKLVDTILICCLAGSLWLSYAPMCRSAEPDRYALVVGVTTYDKPELNTGLKYPENDASELAKLFRSQGYSVDLLLGPEATCQAIRDRLATFPKRGANGGVIFVSLCGHGTEQSDTKQSFFCPFDTELSSLRDADGKVVYDAKGVPLRAMNPESMISIDEVLVALGDAKASNRILVTDCCRDDPNRARGRSFGSSLTTEKLPLRTLLLLSCSAQERSFEHDAWKHGALTKCLLDELRKVPENQKTMGNVAEEVLPTVNRLVSATIGATETQTPRMLSTGRVELHFDKVTSPHIDQASQSLPTDLTNSLGMKLKLIPAGEFLMGSEQTTAELKKMGFYVEFDGNDDERPQHRVKLTKPFYLSIHEVTLGQFLEYYNADRQKHRTDAEKDGKGGGGLNLATGEWSDQQSNYVPWNTGWNKPLEEFMNHPVGNVSWLDAMSFCRWLTQREQKSGTIGPEVEYSLPTEAQWEYACRGGSRLSRIFHFGNDRQLLPFFANIGDKTAKLYFEKRGIGWEDYHPAEDGYVFTAPVGSFEPNGYGLHDMHGNVQEWCLDTYRSDAYALRSKDPETSAVNPLELGNMSFVFRGGGWLDKDFSRVSDRRWNYPWWRGNAVGFRVALVRADSIDAEKRKWLDSLYWGSQGSSVLTDATLSLNNSLPRQELATAIFVMDCVRQDESRLLQDLKPVLNELQLEPEYVNNLCWQVVELFEAKTLTDKELLRICENYQRKVISQDDAGKHAHWKGTLAHLLFHQGKTEDAIQMQKQALSEAEGDLKTIMETNLKKFEKAGK